MSMEQLPLVFFKGAGDVHLAAVARSLLEGSDSDVVLPLDPGGVLNAIRKTRGFARLKIALPAFSFDNVEKQAGFEGVASRTHLLVHFYGNFEAVAQPLFRTLTSQGLACYSVWDKAILKEWPVSEEPVIDGGFAARMQQVLERKTAELSQIEPDQKRRTQLMDAFLKSDLFKAEMAALARKEGGGKKTFTDLVNCFVRWKDGSASVGEMAAIRKLEPELQKMSIAELRSRVGKEERFQLRTAVTARQAEALVRRALELGLRVECEPI